MGDFSKPPLDLLIDSVDKGYVGLHIEQGVPILDRDLNLLNDLIASTVRNIVSRYIGNGLPADASTTGFAIQAIPANNDFTISGPGRCLVGGIEVTNAIAVRYTTQAGAPALTTPGATAREDMVYLDVWLAEVNSTADTSLSNGSDIGIQTSVRQKPMWMVRVAEGGPVPPAVAGHSHYPLAQLRRPVSASSIEASMIVDLRNTRLTLSDMERRLNLMEQTLLLPAFNPSPSQFSPKVGAAAQTVTLFGKNFNVGTVQVRFGAVAAAVIGTPSATQLVTQVPAGVVGGVKITVITGGGSDVSDDTFTVLPSVQPPVFNASPNQFSPKVGSVGQAVTLSGANFNVGAVQVRFDTTNATIVGTPTSTLIVAQVPPGVTGPVKITVINGGGTVISDDTFTVLSAAQPPTFAASPGQFSPKVGALGQQVTLNGNNFNVGTVQVQFGNTGAPIIGTPTATQIVTQVPSVPAGGGGAVKIRVTTGGGSVVSDDNFTIL